jgi:hypothetical protein
MATELVNNVFKLITYKLQLGTKEHLQLHTEKICAKTMHLVSHTRAPFIVTLETKLILAR